MERTIILSSNNEDYLDKFVEPLRRFGYQVEVCLDGETALEKYRKIKPSAVVADLSLPKINGIELCWLIREQDNQDWTPFLILSPNEDKEVKLNCYRSGVDDVLTSPITIRELVIRLEVLIKRYIIMSQVGNGKDTAFYGDLSVFLLADLVQWLNNHKKTGQLWLSQSYQRGSIYFDNGNIKFARLGDQNGEKAIFEMFKWKKGKFEFETGKFDLTENIAKTTLELLLEFNKDVDENRFQAYKSLIKNSKNY